MTKPRFFTITAMIIAAAVSRLIPHPWNFTPIAAMALFGGATFENKSQAFLVTFATLLISDIFLGFHSAILFVYGSFALSIALGRWVRNHKSIGSLAAVSLISSFQFFIVTNAGHWAMTSMYPKTIAGLSECFIAAVPFFQRTLVGDLFYSAVLFGAFALAERRYPELKPSAVHL